MHYFREMKLSKTLCLTCCLSNRYMYQKDIYIYARARVTFNVSIQWLPARGSKSKKKTKANEVISCSCIHSFQKQSRMNQQTPRNKQASLHKTHVMPNMIYQLSIGRVLFIKTKACMPETLRMEISQVIKLYITKLKIKFLRLSSRRNDQEKSASPPRAVHCEELFLRPEGRKKEHISTSENDMDPFILAHIAAQNHFRVRPNIYL